jgi:hypothetical protein
MHAWILDSSKVQKALPLTHWCKSKSAAILTGDDDEPDRRRIKVGGDIEAHTSTWIFI